MRMKLRMAYAAIGMVLSGPVMYGQSDIANLFKGGVNDLNTLVEGYMKPAGQGFAAGLGSNWYNTAATHKVLGFDLTVGVNAALTPSADQYFDISKLENLTAPGGETRAPSFSGSGKGVPLQLKQDGKVISNFTTPDGVTKLVPSPSMQLTFGLPKGTDLSIRFVPSVSVKGFETNMVGFGIKHDVKQWIPGVKLLPFDASAFVGFTKFKLNYMFDEEDRITPDKLFSSGVPYNEPANTDYSGQGFNIDADALTANLIVSKKLAFFTPYLGLGITRTNFKLNFAGNYPIAGGINTSNQKVDVDIMKDPIHVSYHEVMPGATVGFRLKMLMVIAVHAQYTVQKYPTASAGFGINFR